MLCVCTTYLLGALGALGDQKWASHSLKLELGMDVGARN